MTWTKREVSANLVILGDAEGQSAKAGGLLAAVTPDPRYPDNRRYELVQKDGSSKSVAGSAYINSQLGVGDVGKFVRLTFVGWTKSPNGRTKEITVEVYDGEMSDEMKAWPRWAEFNVKAKVTNGAPVAAEVAAEEDDDLPF